MPQLKNDELLNKVVLRIKELRAERGLSQEQVYNDTNINMGRLESEKVNLTVSTLYELCKYFQISLSDFIKDIGE
jgi:transcriptional regulator with XRE-family HTH domain